MELHEWQWHDKLCRQSLKLEVGRLSVGDSYKTTTDSVGIEPLPYKVIKSFDVAEVMNKWASKYARVIDCVICTWDEEPDFTEWLESYGYIKEVISIYPVPVDICYAVGEHVVVTRTDYDNYDILSLMLVLKEFNTKDQLPLWAASHGNISDGVLKGELTTKTGEPNFWEWLASVGLVKSLTMRELGVGEDTNIQLTDKGDGHLEVFDDWDNE